MTQLKEAGTPDPLDFRRARPLVPNAQVLSQTAALVVVTPIAGANIVRIRGKFATTEAAPPNPIGTFSFLYRRSPPDDDTAYSAAASPPVANVNVTASTEFVIDIAPSGESLLAVTYTPAGGIDPAKVTTVTFLDIMQN